MVMLLFILLSVSNYACAGEPINAVAQQKRSSHLYNVRAALSNYRTKEQCRSLCTIVTGLTIGALAGYASTLAMSSQCLQTEDGEGCTRCYLSGCVTYKN